MIERRAYADGKDVGEVYRGKYGGWVWQRGKIATEPYRRGSVLTDVAAHIKSVCRAKNVEIRTVK